MGIWAYLYGNGSQSTLVLAVTSSHDVRDIWCCMAMMWLLQCSCLESANDGECPVRVRQDQQGGQQNIFVLRMFGILKIQKKTSSSASNIQGAGGFSLAHTASKLSKAEYATSTHTWDAVFRSWLWPLIDNKQTHCPNA
jgi:hypothetical protein